MKFAAIIHDTIWHEGDERSRTCPGHGYPAYSESVIKFQPFKDRAEMETWVALEEKQGYGKKKYTLIEYNELQVVTKISVVAPPAMR